MTCLFIGRFQPFHTGHLLVIKGMTKTCSKIVVAIGSAEKSREADNPFTAAERKEMIQRALQQEDIIPEFDVTLVEVPDMESDAQWAKHVLEAAGEVGKLWSGNPDTDKCFEGTGVEIQEIKEVPGISGTEIRKLIREGGDWTSKVPEEVSIVIKDMGGVKIVQDCA